LEKLRGDSVRWRNVPLEAAPKSFRLPDTNTLEIRAELDLQTGQQATLAFKSGTKNTPSLVMTLSDAKFKMLDAESPLSPIGKGRPLRLRIFVDRSVVEVYVNDEVCGTKVIGPLAGNQTLEMSVEGSGPAKARLIEAWPMKTIWK